VLVFASPAGFEQFALDLGHPGAGDAPPPELSMPDLEVLAPVPSAMG
jgi:hypothetical protein